MKTRHARQIRRGIRRGRGAINTALIMNLPRYKVPAAGAPLEWRATCLTIHDHFARSGDRFYTDQPTRGSAIIIRRTPTMSDYLRAFAV